MENAFAVIFVFELCVRCYGSTLYPWLYPMIWLFTFLSNFLEFHKPKLRIALVLRLFRMVRIAKVIDRLPTVVRPLRLLKQVLHEITAVASGMLVGFALAIYFCTMVMVGLLKDTESEVKETYFPDMATGYHTSVITFFGNLHWTAEITAPLEKNGDVAASAFFRTMGFVLQNLFWVFLLAMFMIGFRKAGNATDLTDSYRQTYEKLDVPGVKRWLEKLDRNNDGEFDVDDLWRCYARFPDIERALGLSPSEAIRLMQDVDRSGEGRISRDAFLLGLFYKKWRSHDAESLVREQMLRMCSARAREGRRAIVKLRSVVQDSKADGHEQIKDLNNLVEELFFSSTVGATSMDMRVHDFQTSLDELDAHLSDLLGIVTERDWSDPSTISDSDVKLASKVFAEDLKGVAEDIDELVRKWDAAQAARP